MKPTEKRLCKNCGLTDFQLEARGYWACVLCLKRAKRKYAESDPERAKRQKSESYGRNRTNILASLKKEREENPGSVKARRARHYIDRRDHIRQRVRSYRDSVKLEVMSHYSGGKPHCKKCGIDDLAKLALDHLNEDGRKHRSDIGGCQIYLWAKRNGFPPIFQVLCHNCNVKKHLFLRGLPADPVRARLKAEVLTRYSEGLEMRCRSCPETDIDVLTIDHLNGGGNEHRRSLKVNTGYRFYRWLKREGFPKGFQTLCFNCNLAKHIRRL